MYRINYTTKIIYMNSFFLFDVTSNIGVINSKLTVKGIDNIAIMFLKKEDFPMPPIS